MNIAANAPASVTNSVTVSGGNDANLNNNSSSDPTLIAAPLIDFSSTVLASNGFPIQGQTGISASIGIFNKGNISSVGTVTVVALLDPGLSATAISGTGWTCTLNNLTCTRSDAAAALTGFPNIGITFNIANNAPSSANIKATVSGGGDGNAANNVSSGTVSITPMIVINAIGAVTQTVGAGTPALFQIDANPQSTAGGPATFSCTGLPTGASCSFNPASVTFVSGGTLVSLTVNTTARTAMVTEPPRGPRNYPPLLPLLFLALSALVVIRLRAHLAGNRRFKAAFALTGLLLLVAISGCGGGGGGGGGIITQNPQGTPAGTYPINVVATAPNGSNSATVTLIVK